MLVVKKQFFGATPVLLLSLWFSPLHALLSTSLYRAESMNTKTMKQKTGPRVKNLFARLLE